jgi:hypothetical protein
MNRRKEVRDREVVPVPRLKLRAALVSTSADVPTSGPRKVPEYLRSETIRRRPCAGSR